MIPELIHIGVEQEFAYRYGDWLQLAADRWGIDTRLRRAAWLAQLTHESRKFQAVEESLYYTTPSRLIMIWPTRFRLPVSAGEKSAERFLDGKRNPHYYLRSPETLAEYVYGGRMGNGPEGSGDGWMYRGRGLIHLTGKNNYQAYSHASGNNVIASPDLLAWPRQAADSAGWFWSTHGCNELADARDWAALTRRINGGLNGHSERVALIQLALKD